jgi:hypothetical protein
MAEVNGQFGGRITFNFGGQYIPPSEGEFVIDPALYEVEAKANQDGSMARIMKPKLPGIEIKLRNAAGIDWQAIMLTIGNATVTEQDNGRIHLFTGGMLTGTPKINLVTGEVDGLRVEGGSYQKVG